MSDHTQSLEIAARLNAAVKSLEDMADAAGSAAQVKELSSSRRENLLAKYSKKFIGPKVSISLAQMLARNEPEYLEEFEKLANQHLSAEQTDKHWKARICRYSLRTELEGSKWDLFTAFRNELRAL